MKIPLLNLVGQYQKLKEEIDAAVAEVLNHGRYIMGPEVRAFEASVEQSQNVKHAIGVASGSDALLLSLAALGIGPGDKVIVPTFTFFATASAVSRLGSIPVFVDIDPLNYNLDLNQVEAILKKDTGIKAIIPVHLFGQPCDMERIMALAQAYNLQVIEDACQAINADIFFNNEKPSPERDEAGLTSNVSRLTSNPLRPTRKAGCIGDTGCFSFFPSKNLGGFGDGGMIVTNNDRLAEKLRVLRVHGSKPKYFHQVVGYNSRLDTLQAAILKVKLKYLDEWTNQRMAVARQYHQEFQNQGLTDKVVIPEVTPGHVFHQYVIQVAERDQLAAYLTDQGIGTTVYYPKPLHLQACYAKLDYKAGDLPVAEDLCHKVLALPIDPDLTPEQINYIVTNIKQFIAL